MSDTKLKDSEIHILVVGNTVLLLGLLFLVLAQFGPFLLLAGILATGGGLIMLVTGFVAYRLPEIKVWMSNYIEPVFTGLEEKEKK